MTTKMVSKFDFSDNRVLKFVFIIGVMQFIIILIIIWIITIIIIIIIIIILD